MVGTRGKRVGVSVLRRVAKPIPVIGTVVVLATAYGVLRRKGLMRGSVDIALDSIPIIGTAKGLVEIVSGDLIPDRAAQPAGKRQPVGNRAA
jgi:hypothetical protein